MPKQQIAFDQIVGKTITGISVIGDQELLIAFSDGTFASVIADSGTYTPSIEDNPLYYTDERVLNDMLTEAGVSGEITLMGSL